MFLRNFDFLSPPITFYYKGFLSHSSIVSGIISIVSFILIIIMAAYFSYELIEKKDPKSYNFRRFIYDSGIITMNSTGLFHFISLSFDDESLIESGVDFRSFRIIGFETFYTVYLNKNLTTLDHWIYGLCNKETDTKGIENLVDYDFFNKSACIRKYFNSSEQKYYDIGEPKFKWPTLEHGTYHPENTIYSIILEKCQEDTLSLILGEGNHCKNDEEIKELLLPQPGVRLFYISNYIDVLNYKSPIIKFFNEIENGIQIDKFTMNNINFNPTNITTHNGFFLDNIEIEESYGYDRNDIYTFENEEQNYFSLYCFWLKNNMNYYERTYKRVQDIISDIGGIYQFVTIVAGFLNSFYNKYIVLINIENLLYSSINSEKHNNKKMNDKYEKSRNKSQNLKNKINDSNKLNEVKTKDKIYPIENIENDVTISKSHNNIMTEFGNKNKELKKKEKKENIKDNNVKNNYKTKNFWNYIVYKLSCGKKNNSYEKYDIFRKKIISEEHLIKNHLNIYNLLRVNEKKRNFARNSYKLKDLMKLV